MGGGEECRSAENESRKLEEGQGGVNRSSHEACCGTQALRNVERGMWKRIEWQ